MLKRLILVIIFSLTFPNVVFAQQNNASPSTLDNLSSDISQLLTGNNPVRWDGANDKFSKDTQPKFSLTTPDKSTDTIEAKLVWEENGQELPAIIKKVGEGKFEVTPQDLTTKRLGKYNLEVKAKESFFYTRKLTSEFSWGDLKKEEIKNHGFMKDFLASHPDYQKLSVVKKDKQSVHFLRPDGKIEANFSSGSINYQDDKGNWQPIDPTLKEQGDEMIGSGTPAIFKKDGTVVMKDNPTHTYQTTSYGWYNPETKQFTPIINQLPQGTIEDTKYVRKTQEFKHELIMMDNGLKENLILYSPPTSVIASTAKQSGNEIALSGRSIDPPRNDNSYLTIQTKVEGLDLPDGELGEYSFQGLTFPAPKCRDGEGKEITCTRFAQKINNQQYIYTGFLGSWLTTVAYPVIIDPDFLESINDNYISGLSGDYATARSTPTNYFTTTTDLTTGQSLQDDGTFVWNEDLYESVWVSNWIYYCHRSYYRFDTSSIGSGSTVTQVNYKATLASDSSDTDFDITILKQNWSDQDPMGGGVDTAFDNALTATADVVWRNTSGISAYTQYTSPNMDTSWINKTDNTYYSIVSSRDRSNTTPSGAEFVNIASQETPNVAYRPVLTVLYDVTATPTPVPATKFSGLKMQGIKVQ